MKEPMRWFYTSGEHSGRWSPHVANWSWKFSILVFSTKWILQLNVSRRLVLVAVWNKEMSQAGIPERFMDEYILTTGSVFCKLIKRFEVKFKTCSLSNFFFGLDIVRSQWNLNSEQSLQPLLIPSWNRSSDMSSSV